MHLVHRALEKRLSNHATSVSTEVDAYMKEPSDEVGVQCNARLNKAFPFISHSESESRMMQSG